MSAPERSAFAERSASAKATADQEGSPKPDTSEPLLQPWQFFLLGGMLAATATVIVATGQSPANIIILSLTVVSVSFVGLGAYRILLPLVMPEVIAPPTIAGRTRVAMEREKTLVLRSIKELEFDYAMGKVAKADFDEMYARLRNRALGLMKQLDAGGGYKEQIAREIEQRLGQHPGAPSAPSAPSALSAQSAQSAQSAESAQSAQGATQVVRGETECPDCGTENDEDAKFCKHCGAKL